MRDEFPQCQTYGCGCVVRTHPFPLHSNAWDEAKTMPVKELLQKAAATGWLPAIVGKPWPVEYAGVCPFGADFDYFHELVLHDELARCGAGGVLWGLSGGLSIGLPPVLKFGSKALKDRVAPDCLSGRKVRTCVGEAQARSPQESRGSRLAKATATNAPDLPRPMREKPQGHPRL